MLWKDRRESDNIEDVRDGSEGSGGGGFGGFGGGGGGVRMVGGGCGTLIVIILALVFGLDPRRFLNPSSTTAPSQPTTTQQGARTTTNRTQTTDEAKKFVGVVLADTEDFWNETFRQAGKRYREPKLVLFTDQVRSACGVAGSSTGPFYCPGDEKVYIDLEFFRELKSRFGAPGDFAQAYVIAHEIGHHVQNLLGTSDQVEAAQRRSRNQSQSNDLSVRLELQADFYAGMWARYAQSKGYLERGDIEEALGAAQAVGDDRLQKQAQGYAVPDSFTHGTSQQRARWFKLGFDTGDMRQGNTFNTPNL